jgi:Na+-translocating ferredoxin:NAD+ oxidoreductase RnfC subunit
MTNDNFEKIVQAGIVGAGGGGFPTHVKISSPAKTIIVNGAECEPLLRVDQQLMQYNAEQVIKGLKIVLELTGAAQGIIALKAKYKEAISALKPLIKNEPITLKLLNDFYPAGDEHVTVHEVTGELIPQGAIPIKVGCIVVNVETLINVANAVDDKPVTDTYLTITGQVPNPLTVKLPIGTIISDILNMAGINTEGKAVIEGGPMMGKVVKDLSMPVTKTTKGLIVLDSEHLLIRKKNLSIENIIRRAKAACIQCRQCTDLCPRYLLGHKIEPHKIMRSLSYAIPDEDVMKMSFACSECGLCEQYACIADLSPRTVNAILKIKLSQKGLKPNTLSTKQKISAMREYRKVPISRLINRLGLNDYNTNAPLMDKEYQVDKVKIMLKQHAGAPSKPIVNVGQKVKKGDLIAIVEGNNLGANLHASIDGIVKEINDYILITSNGKEV